MRLNRNVFLFVCSALLIVPCVAQSKLTPEELIAKHVASIGDPAARAAAKARGWEGQATVQMIRGGLGGLQGTATLVNDGAKFNLKMTFPSNDYRGEDISTDGSRIDIATIAPTTRSRLGYFLYTRSEVLKDGLFGGSLSTAWPLLDVNAHQPKLQYQGLKKVDGRDLHDLRYKPRKGEGDLQIDIFFDPESFHHVMTTYSFQVLPGAATSPDRSGGQIEGRYTLRETFGDFHTVNGLTLPARWTMDLSWDGAGPWQQRWDIAWQRAATQGGAEKKP